jgi:hypothetical protein
MAGLRPGHPVFASPDLAKLDFRVPPREPLPQCARFSAMRQPERASRTKRGHAVSALIGILITFLVIILVLYLINMLPLDGRAKQIARVVVIIIGIISLLKYLAVF